MEVQTVDILGVPFSTMTMDETIQHLKKQLELEQAHTFQVVTANPEIVMCAKKDEKFHKILLNTDLITPDGIGVVKASGMLGTPLKERVAGFDLMSNLFAKLSEENKSVSVFLLGAKPHVVQAAANHLTKTYSAASIVGTQDGYFKQEEEENIVSRIQEAKPDLLLVALGFPRQENFIQNNKHRLETKMAVGVGGSLDVWAGEVKRAPKWIQAIHLEWFYRLCSNPTRWRRQLVLAEFLKEVMRSKK
ncbi:MULTISPECIES: WecB/TagA/CpsF family glycosyltransferase [Bacillus]|uniref:N-acetylglucosaminyldiphosphoundecaprenol N-acetyl-beta-D-mannosaminyltransferase n=2 Tax=Bacillus cereus group TaxID=86661 RepID=R8PWN2_BACCE|nr:MULTISPECIES: WecB/TagA/CpsF family glycosyltransferase [Bacillus cereus group]EOP63240.1 WecB/TagA/CpsF family glycosyl transferase [Bacillus cereus VD118]MBJ7985361.1 WecB/TagA/CpsF family glycosyltransferase [Bacillus cereus]MCQ6359163.1 WecB/TagA/CpsF family glycosyltransferase [Bacillus cereus]OOQ93040.1 acetylglucosaminyldiphospho-UDP acetyl-beta-D-mannosaminyltransferase [Bacillus cereus]QWG30775.1 glycosyltransferase [Bacillus mycoides]